MIGAWAAFHKILDGSTKHELEFKFKSLGILVLTDPNMPADTQPKQARSKARRRHLLEHGVVLFNTRGLDDVSIQDITGAVGFSTGSFYSYFADKTEYFVAVQASVAAEQRARAAEIFTPDKLASVDLAGRLRLCVGFAISYFRAHTGLVHAALSYERRIPAGWRPNRQTTAMIIARVVADLPEDQARRLETAIQLAFGLLVNCVLHDPGPLRLGDPALADRILDALSPNLAE